MTAEQPMHTVLVLASEVKPGMTYVYRPLLWGADQDDGVAGFSFGPPQLRVIKEAGTGGGCTLIFEDGTRWTGSATARLECLAESHEF